VSWDQRDQRLKEAWKSWDERDQRLKEAWKTPPKPKSSLAMLIREPSVPIKRVADVLRAECAKRGRGKPGGAHLRWTQPLYLIAWFVESCPNNEPIDKRISKMIQDANGWAIMRDKRRLDHCAGSWDHERVKDLLRRSKRQRL